uniref:ATP synthase F0 subunit 8 n=1 Tax=Colletes gigas TaxID=935657 RepID=A0A0U1YIS9_9HYME|nr:ATP synthase F0 subunit 8 [Colletes gigas]QLI42498.1 ATP synthase F0 subunit 8 [Colletes gigas]
MNFLIPQMMPMNWMNLYFYTLIIIFFIIMMIYFMKYYKMNKFNYKMKMKFLLFKW